MQEKFLTVFASFDCKTQAKLKNLQQIILNNNFIGTQTMDIPFHISLGSFSLEKQKELEDRLHTVCVAQKEFDVKFAKISHFNNKVLYIKPKRNKILNKLHKIFEGNFADHYPFTPHITLYCGKKEQIKSAKKLIKHNFCPFVATVTAISIGEFFPTKIVAEENLQKPNKLK